MKKINIFIVRLLLFFYLTSSYLGATHIHNDALEHASDCKICIVVKNISGGDIPSFDILPVVTFIQTLTKGRDNQRYISPCSKGYFSHAPPFFS